MDSEEAESLLRAACDFQGESHHAREKCRERYRREERNEDNILRILIDGQIGRIAYQVTEKVKKPTKASSYQIGVSASFIRTHFLVSDLALNGDLIEAITLVRKQLECVARLHELDAKPLETLSGRVPNIGAVLKGGSGRVYGDLSEVAHFSTARVAELMHVVEEGEFYGPSLYPTFTENAAAVFDLAHFVSIYFLGWAIEKLPTWYPSYDQASAKALLGETMRTALDAGVVHIDPTDTQQNA